MRTLILVCTMAIAAAAQDQLPRFDSLNWSPDRTLRAEVIPRGKAKLRDSESRVDVRTKTYKLRARRDFSSSDHEHGYGVVQAEWTPDSQFFVFCLTNSGGHSPMHTPVVFYSRRENEFHILDDLLHSSVGFGKFTINAPDKVTISLNDGKKWTGSLSALVMSTQKTKPRLSPGFNRKS